MNWWAGGSFVNLITSLFLGVLVFVQNPRNKKNYTFGFFCLVTVVWSFSYVIWQMAKDYDTALFWSRALMVGGIFVPICYFHHVICLVEKQKKLRWFIISIYIFGFISLLADFTSFFVSGVSSRELFLYWPDPGILFYPFIVIWFLLCIGETIFIFYHFRLAKGVLAAQLKYIFIGTAIGWGGAFTNYPLWFGIAIPPVGNICVSIYLFIVAYAILKYRLMDIRLVISRVAIFIFVYTLVLGVPIWLGFQLLGVGLWLMPVGFMGLLATTGPFIYLYIQKRAEDRLLKEQRDYQETLRKASAGMGRIRELDKLLKLMVFILTRSIRIEQALVYTLDEKQKAFVLSASRRNPEVKGAIIPSIPADSLLVKRFKEDATSLSGEEVHQRAQDSRDFSLLQLDNLLYQLRASLAFPIFIQNELFAIIVLGRKDKNRMYSEDDIAVFSILSNQAALAIENAKFYEDMKLTQAQLLQAEKMATIGTMADGLSHQINNRFHAMGFVAGDARDTIKKAKEKDLAPDMKAVFEELDVAFTRVEDNVHQGGDIVKGLLRYTRKGEEGFTPVGLIEVFKAAYEMAQFKIRSSDLEVVYNVPENLPKIKGNFTQLQEVFFNMIDNGYDAMRQRRDELKEDGYQMTITLSASALPDGMIEIILSDNGMGVKEEDREKLFTPFFTTKLSNRRGTGLGLYVIKKLIEDNHNGILNLSSEYKKGTRFTLRLPSMSQPLTPGVV
ncbi:MAG: GAF domain-containing protein [Candidatus Omnitrophica bacterium]|nr:GAF domain-containing protein [Candidatus Omnitrophota bacterium]